MSYQWIAILFVIAVGMPLSVCAQEWHSRISLHSQVGYASNSYLNDYLSEWDPSLSSSYGLFSPHLLLNRNFSKNAVKFSTGAYYQPYFGKGFSSWSGGFARADLNRRWNETLYSGVKGGASRYHYSYTREIAWMEPYVRVNLSDNMEARLSWNYTYRDYNQLQTDSSTKHYNKVALSYKWWPSYGWELQLGTYSNLEQLRGGDRVFSTYLETTHWVKNNWNISLHAGYEHYGFETTWKRSVGPRCDVYKGCSVNNHVFITSQDDLYNLELSSEYQLTPRWSVNLSAAYLKWVSDDARQIHSQTEEAFSVGATYSIVPDWGEREEIHAPRIQRQEREETLFSIRYHGEGKLYLTGDFNNWERPGIPLIKGPSDVYRTTLALSEGGYEYKILKVQGGEMEWLELDDSTIMVQDGFGGMNGRMVIE